MFENEFSPKRTLSESRDDESCNPFDELSCPSRPRSEPTSLRILSASTVALVGILLSGCSRDISVESSDRNPADQNTVSRQIRPLPSSEEITKRVLELGGLAAEKRHEETRELAGLIGRLPASDSKAKLAWTLAERATSDDLGLETLQSVSSVLEASLRERPNFTDKELWVPPYEMLARLARYSGTEVSLTSESYKSAVRHLEENERKIDQSDFELKDTNGSSWSLKKLRGQVVLLNFWGTGCVYCVEELPTFNALHRKYGGASGLTILNVTVDEPRLIDPFLKKHPIEAPILLDSDWKVHKLFDVNSLPRTVIFDSKGKLAAQAYGRRTEPHLLEMLARAGLPIEP